MKDRRSWFKLGTYKVLSFSKKYVKDYKDGDRMFDIYFCKYKSSAVTKNGKNYDNVILQDRTGTIDAKYGSQIM